MAASRIGTHRAGARYRQGEACGDRSSIALRHTAAALATVAQAPGRLRSHQRFHQEQGWPDIAYHYGIDLAGNVYELRDPRLAGDTFTDYDPTFDPNRSMLEVQQAYGLPANTEIAGKLGAAGTEAEMHFLAGEMARHQENQRTEMICQKRRKSE